MREVLLFLACTIFPDSDVRNDFHPRHCGRVEMVKGVSGGEEAGARRSTKKIKAKEDEGERTRAWEEGEKEGVAVGDDDVSSSSVQTFEEQMGVPDKHGRFR